MKARPKPVIAIATVKRPAVDLRVDIGSGPPGVSPRLTVKPPRPPWHKRLLVWDDRATRLLKWGGWGAWVAEKAGFFRQPLKFAKGR